jgi:3-methyladenine DNA glycosylase AlkC
MADALKHNYNEAYIKRLGKALVAVYPAFDQRQFKKTVLDNQWPQMELKQRLRHITRAIHHTLKLPYPAAIAVLIRACKHFGGYEGMFFPDYVEQYGLEHWKVSMTALEFFTQVSSSEFAVRVFIKKNPEKMMKQMLRWSKHKNYHVRRLASEGCRSRLPWAMALPDFKENPNLIFPILENLKQDDSLYVRKSVANNLNDISKDHPEQVLRWCKKNIGKHPHTDWIIKRACRTLLKAGHSDALQLFNYKHSKKTAIKAFVLNKQRVRLGQTLAFSWTMTELPKDALRVEYGIHFMKKNGKHSLKKFHIQDSLNNEATRTFSKQHLFVQRSTRTHHAGEHRLEIFVNGISFAEKSFMLLL